MDSALVWLGYIMYNSSAGGAWNGVGSNTFYAQYISYTKRLYTWKREMNHGNFSKKSILLHVVIDT